MLGLPKPKKRSALRKWLGKRYFILRRYLRWYSGAYKFAKQKSNAVLPEEVFRHRSLLLRQLKGVDMYLQHNKIRNLELAIAKIDGLIIKPGEHFSFWFLVGYTSKNRGYKEGLMLDNGRVAKGIGGGLCQLGNLIYWMALHTPLTVQERWRHSYDVFPDAKRTLPFGSGATLSYNYIDLVLKNDTQQDFQLQLWLDETHLNGAFRTEEALKLKYKLIERNHEFRGENWGGYSRHNQIFRQIFNKEDEALVAEELITENHALLMYQPFLPESEE